MFRLLCSGQNYRSQVINNWRKDKMGWQTKANQIGGLYTIGRSLISLLMGLSCNECAMFQWHNVGGEEG